MKTFEVKQHLTIIIILYILGGKYVNEALFCHKSLALGL